MEIKWSDEAIADYHQNIDYLVKEWSVQVALEFIEDVDTVVELIKRHPELYPVTDHKEIRRAVIRKQVSLFFKVEERTIHLVRFWNTYQNPESLKL